MCSISHAETFNQYWYVENNTPIQTTCETGGDITLPTAPTKYGYDFIGWEKLPYIPIEYLESTGTQYIDTGVVATNKTKASIQFIVNSVSGYNGIFGAGNQHNTGDSLILADHGTSFVYYSAGANNITMPMSINYKYKCNISVPQLDCLNVDTNKLAIVYSGRTTLAQTNRNLYIFVANTSNTDLAQKSKIKLYSVQIYDNDVLVRDLITVLDKNGVPCMYDKVEHKFYYNAGAGQFIAGPVIGE